MKSTNSRLMSVVVVCLGVLLAAQIGWAQSTTNGAIGGTVLDPSGAIVVGATVTIHNNGTNAEQTDTTDGSGYFRFNNLQPGSYTLTIKMAGFSDYRTEQVIVQVGSLTELLPKLKVSGAAATVEVTAEAPQINYSTPEFAPTLNQEAISNLPINGGRWSSFAILTPGVVSDSSGFGLLSFRGISTLLNNNTIDGADNNQAFFSEERGRTRVGYSSPKAAIEEFQVNTSNYSSEYGRSAGGVVNTVTKSGTNAIHGEMYFYDRDNVFGAANAFTAIAVQTAPGVFTNQNFKPTDWRKMAGLGVGGAIKKDKLFWFLAYDWYHRNYPGTAVTSNPNAFFATPSASTISTLATRLGVTTAAATTIYNNDLAGLATMLGPVPRNGEQTIWLPKLDWYVNQKNHVSFTVNRMRWASPAGIQTQSTNTFATNSFGNDFVKDTWGVAKWDTIFSTTVQNEMRYQYGRDFEYEFAQQPTPYELANLVNAPTFTNPLRLPPQVSITNGFTFGVPTFLQRPAFPDEARQQFADTITWTKGKHTLKFGLDYSRVHDNSQNLRTQFGSYSYGSLLAYFSDLNKPNTCSVTPPGSEGPVNVPCYTSYSQAFGPIGFEFNTNDTAFFAADDWRIFPHFSLSLGVRYEYELLPTAFPALVNSAVPQTAKMPNDKNNVGPRVGFAWDVFGKGKTVLRGGYGIYYGRIINSTIFSALTATGLLSGQATFTISPTSSIAAVRNCAISNPFPRIFSSAPGSSCAGSLGAVFFDSNFQNPQIHQFDLTLERDLGWGTVLSISYLGSLGRELPDFADTNICMNPAGCGTSTTNGPSSVTYNVTPGGPITAATLTEPLFRGRAKTAFGALTDVFSATNSSYHALAVQVNHRMSHHIQFMANYTWSHAIDFGQGQATFNDTNDLLVPFNIKGEKGNSIYDIPNRFVANAVIDSPWQKKGVLGIFTDGWQFSPIFQIQNGLPFTLKTSGSAPGGCCGGINGSGGDFRIDAVGRNTFRFPNTWVADARIAKSFKLTERYKLQLLTDFFNLANKQNVTGVNSTGYFVNSTAASCAPLAAPCISPSATFNTITNSNSNFIYSPRQIQMGVRFMF